MCAFHEFILEYGHPVFCYFLIPCNRTFLRACTICCADNISSYSPLADFNISLESACAGIYSYIRFYSSSIYPPSHLFDITPGKVSLLQNSPSSPFLPYVVSRSPQLRLALSVRFFFRPRERSLFIVSYYLDLVCFQEKRFIQGNLFCGCEIVICFESPKA